MTRTPTNPAASTQQRQALTDALIRATDPPSQGKRIIYDAHRDAPRGFAVRITAGGTKAFVLRYMVDGKDRIATIGTYPTWSLKAARDRARELRHEIDAGTDPLQAERERKAADQVAKVEAEQKRQARERYTLAALCECYVSHLKTQGKTRSANNATSAFKVHVTDPPALAAIATTPACEITPEHIAQLIRRVTEAGKTRTAGMLRAYLHAAFNAARKAPYDARLPSDLTPFGVASNPVEVIATIPVERGDRTLTPEELANYLGALGDDLPDCALKLALLAGGQRAAQLIRARVRDFDPTHKTLLLWDGKGRRAQPRAHLIPLGPEAAALTATLTDRATQTAAKRAKRYHVTADPNPPIFLSRGTIMTDTTPGKRLAQIVADLGCEPFDLRDVRRTVETMMAGIGISKDVRAHLLSHGLSGVQTAHYDRHDYINEKRAALIAWEQHLARISNGEAARPDNVVSLALAG